MTEIRPIRGATLRLTIAVLLLSIAASGCSTKEDRLAELRQAQDNKDFAETIAPLRAMLDENPAAPEVNFLLGRALMRTGDSSSAIWPLRRAMESSDHVVEAGLMLGRAELAFIVINIAFVQHQIIDITQFYTLMFTAFLLNLTVPLSLKWWKPYYLGFKEFKLFGVNLARPEPAPVPDDMPEYKEMMEAEKERYMQK